MNIDNIFEEGRPTEEEKQAQQKEAHARATTLYQDGLQLSIMKEYLKHPTENDWNNKYGVPKHGMTAVGIIVPSYSKRRNAYFYIIDIDIYEPTKRDQVFNEIMNLFESDQLYFESTRSNGYHIIFLCTDKIQNLKKAYNFNYGDKVEFFTQLHVLVAPSWATDPKDPHKRIGKYVKLSDADIEDTAVLTRDEFNRFTQGLENLSQRYQSQTYNHNHILPDEHRAELKQVYHQELKPLGFICAPLYYGKNENEYRNWESVKDQDFEDIRLTGIKIKFGKQKNGQYLNCLKLYDLSSDIKNMIFDTISKGSLVQESDPGTFYVFFWTKTELDVRPKWKLPNNGGKLEVFSMNDHCVQVAPTCYFTGVGEDRQPIYRTFKRLSGSFDSIKTDDAEKMKTFINSLEPNRISVANDIDESGILEQLRQFGDPREIDRQIKLIFPRTIDLLDTLNIRHSNNPKKDYIEFYSLADDDGNDPNALLYHNVNNDIRNRWAGYSVQDLHLGKTISFSKYLIAYDPENFQCLMDKIGFGKIKGKSPITTTYTGKTITLKCNNFISQRQHIEIRDAILDVVRKKKNHQPTIVISAPTSIGKTTMFYRLAKEKLMKMILALPYTAQVLQGKENQALPGVLEGLCENDHDVPIGSSLFMTYDKAAIALRSINPSDYIMVIDEAHNLVNHSTFRDIQLRKLKELADQCKAVVYMTATPDYINYGNVDLLIKVEHLIENRKNGTVVKYGKDVKSVLSNVLVKQHDSSLVDVVYIRNIETLVQIENVIKSKRPDLKTHVLFAENKNDSIVYQSLTKNQQLSENPAYGDIDILFTTNLIVDGVNINDITIGNIYLVDPESTTDLVQFPARFRYGYCNYFIFVTGNENLISQKDWSRQQMADQYYYRAIKQKQSYDEISRVINAIGLSIINKEKKPSENKETNLVDQDDLNSKKTAQKDKNGKKEINLVDQYDLLDDKGNIQENTILLKVQHQEAMRMRSNIRYLKEYLEGAYHFTLTEQQIDDLSEHFFSNKDISEASKEFRDERKTLTIALKNILIEEKYASARNELIKDYLKNRYQTFKTLKHKFAISEHVRTGKYKIFLDEKRCLKILFKWCTGLDLGVQDPAKLMDMSDGVIKSIKRTQSNLKSEQFQLKTDEKYIRFVEVRNWIRSIKRDSNDGTIVINSDNLKEFNRRYKKLYKSNRVLIQDLRDIFDVSETRINNFVEYTIGCEWTMENIHGVSFK